MFGFVYIISNPSKPRNDASADSSMFLFFSYLDIYLKIVIWIAFDFGVSNVHE